MNIWQVKPEELVSGAQLALGVVVLIAVLVWLQLSGRMRRALDLPPVPGNSLEGAHLLFVLIVFLLALQLFAGGLRMLGYDRPAASQPAVATAPSSKPAALEAARPQTTRAWHPDTAPSGEPAPSEATGPQTSRAWHPDDAGVDEESAGEPEEDSLAASRLAEEAPGTQDEPSPDDQMHDKPIQFLIQGLAELVVIGVMLYIVRITFVRGTEGLGLRRNRLGWDLGWAIIGYLAFWPACDLVAYVSTLVYQWVVSETPNEHQVLLLLQSPDLSVIWKITAWTLTGLVAPVFEELLFRGLMLTWLRRVTRSAWLAIIISGLVFGVIHMPQWHLVPALTLLGILLGYLYVRTGSLTLVIFFHAIFNMRTLVMLELARNS